MLVFTAKWLRTPWTEKQWCCDLPNIKSCLQHNINRFCSLELLNELLRRTFLQWGKHEFEWLSLVSSHGCPQNWFFYRHSFHLWWPRTDVISFSITPSIQRHWRPLSSHFLLRITGLLMPYCVMFIAQKHCPMKAWPSLKALCNIWNLDNVNSENTMSRSQF